MEQALIALNQAVADGWKTDWWWDTEYNPNLANIADNDRYHVIVDALAEEMAARAAAIDITQPR